MLHICYLCHDQEEVVKTTVDYIRLRARTAHLIVEGRRLRSETRRNLLTLIAHQRPLTERQLVAVVSLLVAIPTAIAVLV